MKKSVINVFDKTNYLLGTDANGTKYYLQKASFVCNWYWGFGYVVTYTNNTFPERSRDIASHQHFDGLFFNSNQNGYHAFKNFFTETPFIDSEIWQIVELMKTFYICRKYSDLLHVGGAHYTTNPAKEIIQNETEYDRINKNVIPTILNKLYDILAK